MRLGIVTASLAVTALLMAIGIALASSATHWLLHHPDAMPALGGASIVIGSFTALLPVWLRRHAAR